MLFFLIETAATFVHSMLNISIRFTPHALAVMGAAEAIDISQESTLFLVASVEMETSRIVTGLHTKTIIKMQANEEIKYITLNML